MYSEPIPLLVDSTNVYGDIFYQVNSGDVVVGFCIPSTNLSGYAKV